MPLRSDCLIDVQIRIKTEQWQFEYFEAQRIANFGGRFFPIVHLFRLGRNGFLLSRFLSIDSCKNDVVPRGVQWNSFSKLILDAHPTVYYKRTF